MKFLLTGQPRTGKTTLIKSLIPFIENPFWIISEELRDDSGERVGFKAITSTSLEGVFAHKRDIQSNHRIGDYAVDIEQIDKLFTTPLAEAMQDGRFIVLDEIGRMEILSTNFLAIIREIFDRNNNLLATIRYEDEWTKEFTDRKDVITFTLTQENRDDVAICLEAAVKANAMPVINTSGI